MSDDFLRELLAALAADLDQHARDLGDGREATVIPLTFGRARICVARKGEKFYLDGW